MHLRMCCTCVRLHHTNVKSYRTCLRPHTYARKYLEWVRVSFMLGGPNGRLDCILPYIHRNPSLHKKKGPLEEGLLYNSRFQSHVSQVLQYTINDASHLMVLFFHVEDLLTKLTKANKAHKLPHLGASGGPFALPWLLPHPVPSPGLLKSLQTW